MKLDLEQIKNITLGAVRITEQEDGINFFRFTEEQQELYKHRKADFHKKTFCTSGVVMSFRTDSCALGLSVAVTFASGRNYFAFEVFVNGERVGILGNFNEDESATVYAQQGLTDGEFKKEFNLGSGEKEVKIYFPWSVKAVLKELSLDDGAIVEPIKPKCKLLCFGDSITQGYDALYPTDKYATRLATALDAEEHNKAIGGDMFFPDLPKSKEGFVPDIITVAYGTNDWYWGSGENFEKKCADFYKNVRETYPNTPIYAITPLWRKDMNVERPCGDFFRIEKGIAEAVKDLENVTLISGFNLIPHDEKFFGDRRLHPNDEGFEHYFNNIIKYIEH